MLKIETPWVPGNRKKIKDYGQADAATGQPTGQTAGVGSGGADPLGDALGGGDAVKPVSGAPTMGPARKSGSGQDATDQTLANLFAQQSGQGMQATQGRAASVLATDPTMKAMLATGTGQREQRWNENLAPGGWDGKTDTTDQKLAAMLATGTGQGAPVATQGNATASEGQTTTTATGQDFTSGWQGPDGSTAIDWTKPYTGTDVNSAMQADYQKWLYDQRANALGGARNAFDDKTMEALYAQGLKSLNTADAATQAGIEQAQAARGIAGPNVGGIMNEQTSAANRGALAEANLAAMLAGENLGLQKHDAMLQELEQNYNPTTGMTTDQAMKMTELGYDQTTQTTRDERLASTLAQGGWTQQELDREQAKWKAEGDWNTDLVLGDKMAPNTGGGTDEDGNSLSQEVLAARQQYDNFVTPQNIVAMNEKETRTGYRTKTFGFSTVWNPDTCVPGQVTQTRYTSTANALREQAKTYWSSGQYGGSFLYEPDNVWRTER
ncbi:MAG: hypothetical protein ABFD89_22590 [Bryobacteraceae bacterium]